MPLAVWLQEDELIVGVDARDVGVNVGTSKVVDEIEGQTLAV